MFIAVIIGGTAKSDSGATSGMRAFFRITISDASVGNTVAAIFR